MNGIATACTGRVSFDPEERFTANGKALVTFSIVVDQGHTVGTEARAAPAPIYLKVTAWEPSAELLAQLRKGASVYVEGKLTHGTWQGKDGEARCGLSISVWRVDVHGAIGKAALPHGNMDAAKEMR
jgi:single-stranded DNA-binding protein